MYDTSGKNFKAKTHSKVTLLLFDGSSYEVRSTQQKLFTIPVFPKVFDGMTVILGKKGRMAVFKSTIL